MGKVKLVPQYMQFSCEGIGPGNLILVKRSYLLPTWLSFDGDRWQSINASDKPLAEQLEAAFQEMIGSQTNGSDAERAEKIENKED